MDIIIDADIGQDVARQFTTIPHQNNFYHHCLSSLNYSVDTPPVGDWLRRYHGLEGEWCVMTPIVWQATHNDAMIVAAGSQLGLTSHAAQTYFEALATFVEQDGMKLHYHDDTTWLLRIDHQPSFMSSSPFTTVGTSLMQHFQSMDVTHRWQRFLTEVQMYLSSIPCDTSSTSPLVNGVWLWGQGQLHEKQQRFVLCDDDELMAMARHLVDSVQRLDQRTLRNKPHMVMLRHPVLSLPMLSPQTDRYFWNNAAYSCNKSLLTRLRYKLWRLKREN